MQIPYQIVVIAGLLLAFGLPGRVQAAQEDMPGLRAKAAAWMESRAMREHPGATALVEMGAADSRLHFPACTALEFLLPPYSRLWASGSLGVHCAAPRPWTFYLSYRMRLSGPALTARKPLAANQPISAEDVETRVVEYDRAPAAYLTQLPEGATLTRPVNLGQPLAPEMLVMPEVIKTGKRVTVRFAGNGFQVTHEGIAQNSARTGESVRVKVSSGRLVTGIASADGVVEVKP
ncbi:MAG: flagellar basal body P-ring formation protein FlgA [Betaproteobacteria bacterium]|nr:flagellar basal body P-ring formation protein FlgA [Betaproteobacteria bacterium]